MEDRGLDGIRALVRTPAGEVRLETPLLGAGNLANVLAATAVAIEFDVPLTAIADEMHAAAPDGSPYLGISLRQYDVNRRTWVIEYLNVTHSFVRRQVNSDAGSVDVSGRTVTVSSESPEVSIREHYHVADRNNFIYRMDVSNDGGKSWNKGQIEMTFRRSS